MKLWHGIAIIAGFLLIVWGISMGVNSGGWLGNNEEVATQKPPSYTADQVIVIVQAQYPACYKYEGMFPNRHIIQTQPSITVNYLGDARWKVQISCPLFYYLESPLSGVTSLKLYFWETDGSLHSTAK